MSNNQTPSAHTEGPWFIGEKCPWASKDPNRTEFYIYSKKGNIATVPNDLALHVNHQALANSRLIAAAPELLAAVRLSIECLRESTHYDEMARELEALNACGSAMEKAANFPVY